MYVCDEQCGEVDQCIESYTRVKLRIDHVGVTTHLVVIVVAAAAAVSVGKLLFCKIGVIHSSGNDMHAHPSSCR